MSLITSEVFPILTLTNITCRVSFFFLFLEVILNKRGSSCYIVVSISRDVKKIRERSSCRSKKTV